MVLPSNCLLGSISWDPDGIQEFFSEPSSRGVVWRMLFLDGAQSVRAAEWACVVAGTGRHG